MWIEEWCENDDSTRNRCVRLRPAGQFDNRQLYRKFATEVSPIQFYYKVYNCLHCILR